MSSVETDNICMSTDDDEPKLLAPDKEIGLRQAQYEQLFKDFSQLEEEVEISLDEISDYLNIDNHDEGIEDEEQPEAAEELPEFDKQVVPLNHELDQRLRQEVAERTDDWDRRGVSFSFQKVDEWLRKTQSTCHALYSNGDEMFRTEQTDERRYTAVQRHGNPDFYDRLNGMDADDSSVDTAQYILANQKKGSSQYPKKMVITKYQITTKKMIEVTEYDGRVAHGEKMLEMGSGEKRRRRRTRGELNKLKAISMRTIESDTESESPPKRYRQNHDYLPPHSPKRLKLAPPKIKNPLSETEEDSEGNRSASTMKTTSSLKDLPKKVVIYTPSEHATGKIQLTNQTLIDVLGETLTQEVLQNEKINAEIDAKSKVFLELPSTDPEDSEEDFCIKVNRVPRLSIVPVSIS